MCLNRKQLRTLKKQSVVYTEPTYNLEIEFLKENGLVSVVADFPDDYMMEVYASKKGKAYLYERFHQDLNGKIAILISLLSLVASAISAIAVFT